MAERGATLQVSLVRRGALKAVRSLFSPLLPDDYIELINLLWSTRELRGRIEHIRHETAGTGTFVLRPGHAWPRYRPRQYPPVGVGVDGIVHWPGYSPAREPDRDDRRIANTPKLVEEGKVTPFLVRQAKPGAIV